jgi:CRISPR-associated endonuclease/helicase Cas3
VTQGIISKFAHSRPEVADQAKWEPLAEHLQAVGSKAAEFAAAFGFERWGDAAGLLHDIGKVSDAFQAYIRGVGASPDHSTAGAAEAAARYGKVAGRLLALMVAGHHAGLADGRDLDQRLKKRLEPYDGWEAYTGQLPLLAELVPPPGFVKSTQYPGFETAFLTRMIFSCLVDADFLETERFYTGARENVARSMVSLRDRLRAHMADKALKATGELKGMRAEILAHAVGKAALAPGMFTMTVPTGGGKTLASLSFAIEHAVANDMRRVIYVAPYTAIIEQTAQVFREALGAGEDILEHHSNFDWDAKQDRFTEEDGDGLKKLELATENWDVPVVVTTAVQFFESLFAARTGQCRKLHNIANSVLILDEAQTLPLKLLRPCMAALDELARNYGASIVLCTATQPALRVMDNALPLNKKREPQGFDIGPERELAPNPEALYVALKRVKVDVREDPVADAEIATRFAARGQMLCIVNTRGHAKTLFDLIVDQPGARHLTTLMCPAHRRQVLAEVKADLTAGRPVRLVATSLVEAGVDFSFPEVWRAETGLDSIAQAAGRCNRDGGQELGQVVVFKPAEQTLPPVFRAGRDAARLPLQLTDPLGLAAVEQYFRTLYFTYDFPGLDSIKIDGQAGILTAIGRTKPANFLFAEIAEKFKLIDETMQPVIIPWDDEAKKGISALRGAQIPPGRVVRKLQQYTVSVPTAVWRNLARTGAIQEVNPDFGDRFMQLCSDGLYEKSTGLRQDDPTSRTSEQNIIC